MTSLPYMQLYVSDYLADTAHLTAQQHGAYMLLLMNYWQRGKPLDNSNERLSFVARLSPEEWLENKSVLEEFFVVEGSTWTHLRIETDLEKIREKSLKASSAGRRSVEVRLFNGRSTPVEQALNHKEEDKEEDKDINKQSKMDFFEQFWKIYPRKVAKQAALKAFLKAIQTTDPLMIIEGARKYAEDPNRNITFTAHGATWLNAHRWLDEPLPPKYITNDEKKEKELQALKEKSERERREAEEWFQEQERLKITAVPMPQNVKELLKKTLSK